MILNSSVRATRPPSGLYQARFGAEHADAANGETPPSSQSSAAETAHTPCCDHDHGHAHGAHGHPHAHPAPGSLSDSFQTIIEANAVHGTPKPKPAAKRSGHAPQPGWLKSLTQPFVRAARDVANWLKRLWGGFAFDWGQILRARPAGGD